jgi:hypothetical protein
MVSYDIPTGDFVYYVLKIGGYGNEGGEAVYRVGLSGGNLRLLDNMEKVPRIVSADEEAPAIPPWVRRGLRWKSIVHAYECNAMTPTAVKRKTYFVAEKAVEYYKNLNIPPS